MYDGDVTARVALLGEASGVQTLASIDYRILHQEVERQRLELKPGKLSKCSCLTDKNVLIMFAFCCFLSFLQPTRKILLNKMLSQYD